jgi:hypothetical protein
MEIRIKYIDETTALAKIRIIDRYAWEQKHKKSISDFEKNPALGDILWMTHRALARDTEGLAPFDVWVNQVDDFDIVEADPKS